ncbi:MAG: NUDIX domain-containing protein [Succinivibrio sp.]|nr:NUDIX domain-containing protein [Succinivibrio sp.]
MAADELVDVVDENNNVIKTVTREYMRINRLAHRASYIVCADRQGRYLIEVRTLQKDYAPGLLDACVGGVMQHGESPVQAAKREVLEEVGIDCDSPENEFYDLGTLKIMWADNVHFLYGYLYFAVSDSITVRQQSEVSGIMMLSLDEIERIKDNCVRDSLIAFYEIKKRLQERKDY